MKPIDQTIFLNDPHGRLGNCLQATIASVLEVNLDEVPHFITLPDDVWFKQMCDWFDINGIDFITKDGLIDSCEYLLASGKSPRESYHMVVYKDGALVHDPHPSRDGVIGIEWSAILRRRNKCN